jgi:ribosomal protein S18 acetylase RimI-like enzyme
MEDIFSSPFLQALKTEHAGIAIGSGLALRYPADIIPFGGLAEATSEAMTALGDLLQPDEVIYVTGDQIPQSKNIVHVSELHGWQMHFRNQNGIDSSIDRLDGIQIKSLEASDAPSMVALTNVAFPGYFRPRTYVLGSYYGIHVDGELIAMAGERVVLPGSREVSAICTHPAHTGKGYAGALTRHVLRAHAATGLHSFLHVAAANQRAISLYERLGFVKTIPMLFHKLRRC